MHNDPKYTTWEEILSAYRLDIPKYLLPANCVERYMGGYDRFMESLSPDSHQQHTIALREKINGMFATVLSGKYERPLSAFLRETPDEIVYFYIDRIRSLEQKLARYARSINEPVLRPSVWIEYWFKLLTQQNA